MIGTTAAIIGASIIGAGATAMASSSAAGAAKKQGQLSYDATQSSIAEQQRQFNAIQTANEPFRQVGLSAASALAGGFGLSGYGAPSMTGTQVASTPVPNAGGISMTGAKTGNAGVSPTQDYAGSAPVSMTGGSSAPAAGSPDYAAYMQQNPDVAAEYNRLKATADPNSPWYAQHGMQSPEAFAQYHYQANGQAEGRPLPTTAQTQAPAPSAQPATTSPSGTPSGYTDPTAPAGYTVSARPTALPTPAAYAAPARQTMAPLDVSLGNYQQSPDFNFRLQQGQNALDHVASSMGGVMSGARIKAADRYNQDYATTDYNNWRDYTTSEYNVQQNRADTVYNSDRAFGYGQGQDAIAQSNLMTGRNDANFNTDRSNTQSRYDTRNNQLLQLAGFGTAANSANQSAAQSFANNSTNLTMSGAQAQGNAAVNAANAWTSGTNNLLTTGAYLGGKMMTGGLGTSTAQSWANFGQSGYGGSGGNWTSGLGLG